MSTLQELLQEHAENSLYWCGGYIYKGQYAKRWWLTYSQVKREGLGDKILKIKPRRPKAK